MKNRNVSWLASASMAILSSDSAVVAPGAAADRPPAVSDAARDGLRKQAAQLTVVSAGSGGMNRRLDSLQAVFRLDREAYERVLARHAAA
jgi:hypothetical protein